MLKRRTFGSKLEFRSLSCEPINEQGVVYLFGVLHDIFDFKIESIQTGFPDCIARRKLKKNRWEEIRIEFEFESINFKQHGHPTDQADMIICWKHNWSDCPENIEVIELSSQIEKMEVIQEEVKEPRMLSEYQRFCQEKRLEGFSFSEISSLWRERK